MPKSKLIFQCLPTSRDFLLHFSLIFEIVSYNKIFKEDTPNCPQYGKLSEQMRFIGIPVYRFAAGFLLWWWRQVCYMDWGCLNGRRSWCWDMVHHQNKYNGPLCWSRAYIQSIFIYNLYNPLAGEATEDEINCNYSSSGTGLQGRTNDRPTE